MKIAIIDSGIHAGHPHVGQIAGAMQVTHDGFGDDPVDRLGHGTAVAAAIREKAPHADLYAVKVFDRRLSTTIAAILRALVWCREEGMDLVNLSLGTANPDHSGPLTDAIAGNMFVVSAAQMLPGSLPGVIGVLPDESCPRDEFRYRDGLFHASPYPRPIPGVSAAHNLQGVSFAVANMTGLAAQALAGTSRDRLWTILKQRGIYLPEALSAEYSSTAGDS